MGFFMNYRSVCLIFFFGCAIVHAGQKPHVDLHAMKQHVFTFISGKVDDVVATCHEACPIQIDGVPLFGKSSVSVAEKPVPHEVIINLTPLASVKKMADGVVATVKKYVRNKLEQGYREFTKREIKRFIQRAWVPATISGVALIVWYLALRHSINAHRALVKDELQQFFATTDLTRVVLQQKIKSL